MSGYFLKSMVLLTLVAGTQLVCAATPVTSLYTLNNLQKVVPGDANCNKIYAGLQGLTKKQIAIEVTEDGKSFKYSIKHPEQKIDKHTYSQVLQSDPKQPLTAMGSGTFDLNNDKIDYVVQVSLDMNKPSNSYDYPVIFSYEKSHCVYTAILSAAKPAVASAK